MSFPGGGEWVVVLLILLLLFGASRLPKLARSMGQASREFKNGVNDPESETVVTRVPRAS